MPNMNVLFLTVQKLWPWLKFKIYRSKVTVNVTTKDKTFHMIGKTSSQRMFTWNMKVLPLMVQKL